MPQTKMCACEKPIPSAQEPQQIRCFKCHGTLAIDRKIALLAAIHSVEETQSECLYAAGIAFFLEDAGFDFDEIYECLQERGGQQEPVECEVSYAD